MNTLNERLYFFSDIDGTLLHKKIGKYEPNIENKLTIQNFVSRGHAFIMATGRDLVDVEQIAKKLQVPVEYAITYNGAFVYKHRREISSNTLGVDQIMLILAVAKKTQLKYDEILLFAETGDIYIQPNNMFGHVYKLARQVIPTRSNIKPWKNTTLKKLTKRNIRLPKICLTSMNPYVIINLEKKLQTLFRDRLSIYCSSPHVLEICDAGVDKSKAIELIMQRENISLNHVGFVGDSGNDVGALRILKHAYVMEHVAKEVAIDDVTITPNVAGAISHFIDVYRVR